MSNTTMTIKVDKDIKDKAQATAKKMGLPLSTIINAYLRDVATTGRVEFSVTEQMTPQMERLVEGFQKEIKSNELSPVFSSTEDAIAYLKSQTKKYRK